jgi:hypothetical protein
MFENSYFVQNVIPFLTSFSIHIGAIFLGMITYKTVATVVQSSQNQVVIPTAEITDQKTPELLGFVGVPRPRFMDLPDLADGHFGFDNDPSKMATQNKIMDPKVTGYGEDLGKVTLMNAGGGVGDTPVSIIGIGLATGKGRGLGSGTGDSNGSGDGGFGVAPWGVGGGGDRDHLPTIFADPKNKMARKIVFVCDASGSMMNRFDDLRIQINNAVRNLRPTQFFNVMFFKDKKPEIYSLNLMMAIPSNKDKLGKFLENVVASGQTDPMPAIEAAFRQSPELIYLLTDGDFPDNDLVIASIRKINPQGKVKINTIAFINHGEEYEKVLRNIANENGGTFKFVGDDDLR